MMDFSQSTVKNQYRLYIRMLYKYKLLKYKIDNSGVLYPSNYLALVSDNLICMEHLCSNYYDFGLSIGIPKDFFMSVLKTYHTKYKVLIDSYHFVDHANQDNKKPEGFCTMVHDSDSQMP